MINEEVVISLRVNLLKTASAEKILSIRHCYDLSLYSSSVDTLLRMIQATDLLVKNDCEPDLIHRNSFYRLAKIPVAEFYVCQSEQDEKNFSTFALFLETMIKQSKIFPN